MAVGDLKTAGSKLMPIVETNTVLYSRLCLLELSSPRSSEGKFSF